MGLILEKMFCVQMSMSEHTCSVCKKNHIAKYIYLNSNNILAAQKLNKFLENTFFELDNIWRVPVCLNCLEDKLLEENPVLLAEIAMSLDAS